MARAIMVPLDGSTFAEHALPAAVRIAKASDHPVHLVQVHELPVIPTSPDVLVPYDARWDAGLRQQEQAYLEGMANRVSERFGIPVRTELLDGQPAMALSAYAQETDVELIMMTTHGRSGLSRAWLGSVADGVIRRSGVPVLLLRPTHDEVDFDESITPRHILIPLDGSELSRGVIDPATWLGSLSGARFTLLRVVLPLPLLRPPFPSAVPGFDEAVLEEQRVHARAEMDSIAEHLRERGIDVEVAIVSHSVPAGAIIEFAESNAIDMIALATHGRGGWTRIALGSVADKVVRGSQIPVMVYRPKAGRNGGNVIERAAVGAHA